MFGLHRALNWPQFLIANVSNRYLNRIHWESHWIPCWRIPAICSPPCQNSGVCLSYNVCQCPQDYRGKQCQYNVEVCSPKKMNFNGAYNCSGDNEALQCTLSCPSGVEVVGQFASVYTCSYENGFFEPTQIPECKYSELRTNSQGGRSKSISCMSTFQVPAWKSLPVVASQSHRTMGMLEAKWVAPNQRREGLSWSIAKLVPATTSTTTKTISLRKPSQKRKSPSKKDTKISVERAVMAKKKNTMNMWMAKVANH